MVCSSNKQYGCRTIITGVTYDRTISNSIRGSFPSGNDNR